MDWFTMEMSLTSANPLYPVYCRLCIGCCVQNEWILGLSISCPFRQRVYFPPWYQAHSSIHYVELWQGAWSAGNVPLLICSTGSICNSQPLIISDITAEFSIKMSSYQCRKSHNRIRQSYNNLVFAMGFPILVRWHLHIELGPSSPMNHDLVMYWHSKDPFQPVMSLQWRHNGRNSVTTHQPHDCLLNRLFGHRWKKTSKLRVTGLCVRNSPETGEFPTQMASNAENVSIWWHHHVQQKGPIIARSVSIMLYFLALELQR